MWEYALCCTFLFDMEWNHQTATVTQISCWKHKQPQSTGCNMLQQFVSIYGRLGLKARSTRSFWYRGMGKTGKISEPMVLEVVSTMARAYDYSVPGWWTLNKKSYRMDKRSRLQSRAFCIVSIVITGVRCRCLPSLHSVALPLGMKYWTTSRRKNTKLNAVHNSSSFHFWHMIRLTWWRPN